MTGIEQVQIRQAMVHRVGNPTRGEALHLSRQPLTLNDETVRQMLLKYFLQPINEREQYRFAHMESVSHNELYRYVQAIFSDPASLPENSQWIAKLLHSKSTHVRVKQGELYVALLDEVPFENETVQAIGLFKSESKEQFLKVFEHGQNFELASEEGIDIRKLDKGCLIFRREESDGYRLCIVDNTNKQQDAQYWVDDFLQVTPVANEYHQTNNFLQMCRQFITEELPGQFEVTRHEQMDLMQRSMDYFKTREQFQYDEFASEVIHHPEVVEHFDAFRDRYARAHEMESEACFEIDTAAVKRQSRVYKSVLKLDRNFHIYVHGRRDLIERGYDAEKGKYFYKVYFDEEA